jgi:AraC-like DNA-binding protein
MGRESSVNATTGYCQEPGEEEQVAYEACGDVVTSVTIADELWRTMAGDARRPGEGWTPVDSQLELAHRMLLRDVGSDDPDFAIAESLLELVAIVLHRRALGSPALDRLRTGRSAHALADAARDAIAADHPAAGGLLSLATLLQVSPYHLSRVFRHQWGITLTRYRNRARVSRALERIEQGERNLAQLAADLGFADQAHLSRTMKAELGTTPRRVRRLLTAT